MSSLRFPETAAAAWALLLLLGTQTLSAQDRLERIGFDGTIGKPSTMEEIRTAVSQVMGDQPVPEKR